MARKILLADDSVTAQNMGRKILSDAGYEVVTVNNGSAALKKIAEIKPDLVILDVYMPGYSGLEVCQRLKETPDSSRIPVLLTVGKLEPFKPEEAQRVRAEAFIVKPFEASELLSALSRLEDKVVPRSEPSKPGRFARAMASVEESSRSQIQPVSGDDENGWKSRISFPHEKKEEEKVVDDASIYNPVNRDLRTVVAPPAERVEEKKEEKRPQEMAVEPSVDLEAVAPVGVPQDVTPEEVAAIAAAAAQIQMLRATLEERDASENVAISASVPAASATADAQLDAASSDLVPSTDVTQLTEDEKANEAEDVPMTMAAATAEIAVSSASGSRWTAVSVALDAEEAKVSLEQEMQKAYAAFVAEQAAPSEPGSEQVRVESFSPPGQTAVEQALAPISDQELQPEPQAESAPVIVSETPQVESTPAVPLEEVAAHSFAAEPVAVSEPASFIAQPESEYSSPAAEAAVETQAEVPAAQLTESEPALPHAISTVTADSTPPVTEPLLEPTPPIAQESAPAPEAEIAEAAVSSHTFTSFISSVGSTEEPRAEAHAESRDEQRDDQGENVKSTAAAWATWRQIRDGNEPKPVAPEAQTPEPAIPVLLPAEAAAMAVAAGAEHVPQEIAQPSAENPADVASIVDSVLADLRPRLMAEISRKMSEKK